MLKIFKASAGSGKTFRLVLEYFILIFSQTDGFKHSLAVTFTNKATEEMKLRIIEELYLLSLGTGKSNYEEELLKSNELHKAGITKKSTLYKKAKDLLKAILHDYSKLSVTTIDKFFQKLIRSFLRELKKSPSYSVELDIDSILSLAVERVINRIPTDKALKVWVKRYVDICVNTQKKVKLDEALNSFGKELFKESTMEIEEHLFNYSIDDVGEFYDTLTNLLNDYESEYTEYCSKFLTTLNNSGATYDLLRHKKNGGVAIFIKGANRKEYFYDTDLLPKRFIESLNTLEWFSKDDKKWDIKYLTTERELHNIALLLHKFIECNGKKYASAMAMRRNLYSLAILKYISEEMINVCRESDTMMLHDTTKLLKRLINNNDTSFIFEKLGNYYNNIMIDEFQDTSRMQWDNLQPLILNSISSGNNSLVVGDIKQSIYKFRNGDWRLLAYDIVNNFKRQNVIEEQLKDNWRSYKNIVNFNNIAFKLIAEYVNDDIFKPELKPEDRENDTDNQLFNTIISEYREGRQKAKKSGEGRLGFYFTVKQKSDKKSDIQDRILVRVNKVLHYLQSKGAKWSDCTILVSTSNEAAVVANNLIKLNIPFVSNESLKIDNSIAIKFIIALLNLLRQPNSNPFRANLLSLYYKLNNSSCPEEIFFNCHEAQNIKELLNLDFDIDESKMATMSLYDLIEYIISIFNLGKNAENINYLISFQDIVFNYVNRNKDSLSDFLDKWENTLHNTSITLSDNSDSVKIMTIHKSKGLQFKHVIIPFFDWEFFKYESTMWVNVPGVHKSIKYFPINFNALLKSSLFREEFNMELARTIIDRLNVIYVALTRAVESLHICTTYNFSDSATHHKSNDILKKFLDIEKSKFKWDFIEDNSNLSELIYELGDIEKCDSNHTSNSDSANESKNNELVIDNYTSYTNVDKFVVKSTHDDFVQEDDNRTRAIDEGKLQHFIMQNIIDENCVEQGVSRAVYDGLLSIVEVEKYNSLFHKYMKQVESRGWFKQGVTTINEREIMISKDKFIRPDRVVISANEISVIDFKFGAEYKEYEEKVKTYCEKIEKMDKYNRAVKGYLWYPLQSKILALD